LGRARDVPSLPTRRSSDLALVAGREHAREGDNAVAPGLLDAAQVVLVGDTLRVEGVPALAVAVPDVDGRADHRLAAVRSVLDGKDRKSTRLNSSHDQTSYA